MATEKHIIAITTIPGPRNSALSMGRKILPNDVRIINVNPVIKNAKEQI